MNLAAFGQEFHKSMPAIYLLCFRPIPACNSEPKLKQSYANPVQWVSVSILTRLNSIRVNYLTTLVLPPLHSNPRQLCSPRSLYFTFYSSISDSTCGFYGYCIWVLGLMEQNLNSFYLLAHFTWWNSLFPPFSLRIDSFCLWPTFRSC